MEGWGQPPRSKGTEFRNAHSVLVIKLQGLLFPNLLNWKHLSLPAIGVGGAQWFGGTESEFGSTVLPRRHQLNREVSRSLACGTRLTVTSEMDTLLVAGQTWEAGQDAC